MRPGQAAPVFVLRPGMPQTGMGNFNEAGAGCPGILGPSSGADITGLQTSMRPGQAAPVFSGKDGEGRKTQTELQ